jgi:heme exporter protein C
MTQGIITGSVWAKATWGVWWTWEPRLTTSAVLWVIYASYLTLRRTIEEKGRQARIAAVYSIVGFVSVPINFMAIRWWRTVHPLVFEGGSANLEPSMLFVLIFSVVAFTFLYFSLLNLRLRLAATEAQVQLLKHRQEM